VWRSVFPARRCGPAGQGGALPLRVGPGRPPAPGKAHGPPFVSCPNLSPCPCFPVYPLHPLTPAPRLSMSLYYEPSAICRQPALGSRLSSLGTRHSDSPFPPSLPCSLTPLPSAFCSPAPPTPDPRIKVLASYVRLCYKPPRGVRAASKMESGTWSSGAWGLSGPVGPHPRPPRCAGPHDREVPGFHHVTVSDSPFPRLPGPLSLAPQPPLYTEEALTRASANSHRRIGFFCCLHSRRLLLGNTLAYVLFMVGFRLC